MQRIALLESEKHGGQGGAGSAASIALHAVILAFAIAVTSRAGDGARRDRAVYVPLPRWRPEVRMVEQPVPRRASPALPHAPVLSIAVPTVIPTSIPAPTVAASLPSTTAPASASIYGQVVGDTAVTSSRSDNPFSDLEVDVAASVLAGQRGPSYPEGLRVIGVDGRVLARFIIGRNGRVENDPVIVSATADEFAASVRRYLAGARYRPATKNGEAVRQLAEQEFDFAVRR